MTVYEPSAGSTEVSLAPSTGLYDVAMRLVVVDLGLFVSLLPPGASLVLPPQLVVNVSAVAQSATIS